MTLEERNQKLAEAKALVLKSWNQGCFARNAEGLKVGATSPEAVSFCMFGAIMKVTENDDGHTTAPIYLAIWAQEMKHGIGNMIQYNDTKGRTKEEVAAIFDYAMAEPI